MKKQIALSLLLLLLPACTIEDRDMHCEKLLDRLITASARCDLAQDEKGCKNTGSKFVGAGCAPCFGFVALHDQFGRQCAGRRE